MRHVLQIGAILVTSLVTSSTSTSSFLQEELLTDCEESEGLLFVQSVKERRRQVAEDAPFASLVGESSQESPSGFKTVLQIKEVMALAQTKVQTKVGEAPYFVIAVAVGGFTLSLLSICVSLIFVKGVTQDARREGPTASALLGQRLRAMGIGQPKWQNSNSDKVAPSRAWQFSPDRRGHVQVVVRQPLEGGKLGLNLSEDDLVVNNFGDFRACDFGFQIGDRIVQVNSIPVFKEADFRFVMQDALIRHEDSGEPIVFEVIRAPKNRPGPAGPDSGLNAFQPFSAPATSPAVMRTILPNEDIQDITGEWCYGKPGDADRFTYWIRKAGEALGFEQTLANGQKVTGVLTPEDPQSPWLRSELQSPQGLFGELRIHFDPTEQVLVSQVRPAGRQKWGDERVARRVVPNRVK